MSENKWMSNWQPSQMVEMIDKEIKKNLKVKTSSFAILCYQQKVYVDEVLLYFCECKYYIVPITERPIDLNNVESDSVCTIGCRADQAKNWLVGFQMWAEETGNSFALLEFDDKIEEDDYIKLTTYCDGIIGR